uniref:NID domain-containing protein n=1 Tax=Knipowitschia caucasica TaxID=637954 RepID=A0AAV2KJV4_KNICA
MYSELTPGECWYRRFLIPRKVKLNWTQTQLDSTMSSEEDFSLISEPTEETVDGVRALIKIEKDKWSQLQIEHSDLRASISEIQSLTFQFKERTKVLLQQVDQAWTRDQHRDQLMLLQLEQEELRLEEERVLSELQNEEELYERLKEEAQVVSAAPERPLVFRGVTVPADAPIFLMDAQVHLPMEGGTALITFEEVEVAQRILSMHRHKVDLGGEFYMNVEARGVTITSPCTVEVQVQVCPHMVLVSGLPQMDSQTLQDKLHIHFSRSKNGGGEVDEVHLQEGGGTATISFVNDDVSKRLTDKQFHDVKLTEGVHRVRVSPFLSGDITHLQSRRDLCLRTVLLTGIPDIADPESLQDLIEIHFQRSSSGGGEVEGLLYCPEGKRRTALLCSKKRE